MLELELSRRRLAEAESLARVGSWEWDVAADRVTWSDQLFRIYGLEPQSLEPTYEAFLERVHPDDRESVDARNHKAFADHRPFEDVKRVVRPDGSVFLMRTQGEVIEDDEGGVARMIGVCEDVTERVEAERTRSALAAIVTSSHDAIWSYDLGGRITSWNPGAERLFGYTEEEALGCPVSILVPQGQVAEHRRTHELAGAGEAVEEFDTRRLRNGGREMDVSIALSPVKDASGEVTAISAIAQDIAERKRLETEIRWLASHDPLTGLYNRSRFEEDLSAALARASRRRARGSVVLLDLDNFKFVNDTYGHRAGDALVRAVAGALQKRLRLTDVLARLGGDEFAILMEDTEEERAASLARDLLETVRATAISIEGHAIRVTTSAGASMFTGSESGEAVLAAADRAMYEAKDAGRDRVVVHSPGRSAASHDQHRTGWEAMIREALEGDGFVLHCQPIVELASGRVTRHELLLRMRGDDGLIAPASFLAVAERLGLVGRIDRWVVESALGLLADSDDDLVFEVNLSGQSVGDRRLLERIEEGLADRRVDPERLIFEITETAAITNMDDARLFAEALTRLGCRVAIDDFGAGFGSFYYLKHLPADLLKIDGDFVRAPRTVTDELVIEAIVRIARGLGKKTVAEYVEDQQTMDMLRARGVDYAQGFHVGRPVPVEELGRR
ncbi:MAG TPA: EAL domain-containing protein [Thermoleophilaceae bacterium]|nr:EAL domain-containing protein [Thermoleophilaceae bacterium]